MPAEIDMDFIIAITFVVAAIILVLSAFAYQLVSSGKRLKKAQRLSDAILEYTPAFIMIIFDDKKKVVSFNTRMPSFQGFDGKPPLGKKLDEVGFLPSQLRQNGSAVQNGGPPGANLKSIAPIKLNDGTQLFIDWELLPFRDRTGKVEFHIAYGYDRTELLQSQQKLAVLTNKLEQAEEQSRKKIAEDLHDKIGEILIASNRGIARLKRKINSEDAIAGLDALGQSIQQFTTGARSLIFDLIPRALYSLGLGAAVENFATQFSEQHHLSVKVADALQNCQVDQSVAIFLFKAIRESAINAIKHGKASELLITLQHKNQDITISVEDNGCGFAGKQDLFRLKADSGFGLFNLKNRAEQFKGNIGIEQSEALGGGKITISVPGAITKEEECP
ncbi:MAG: PAS domain-containing protein [Deferribacteres bacterium]|nr:PAS domain-containing protein [candidate division KSB1 bacterium]MCB9510174.1 PAS domain-containing protein [Deferribacteres bacterium]